MENHLEQQIAVARGIFSRMPDQLFDMYIRALINDMGNWPFHSCMDFTYNTPWHRIFSVVSLHEQSSCKWRTASFMPSIFNITQQSLADIDGLLQNYNGMLLFRHPTYDYDYCRKSTEYHIAILQRSGTYQLPVAVYPVMGRFHVLDGNHRIGAALQLLATTGQSYSIPAWIAEV